MTLWGERESGAGKEQRGHDVNLQPRSKIPPKKREKKGALQPLTLHMPLAERGIISLPQTFPTGTKKKGSLITFLNLVCNKTRGRKMDRYRANKILKRTLELLTSR